MPGKALVSLELEPHEIALVIGEEDEGMSVRIVAGTEMPEDAPELPAAAEIIVALATRLLKDPEFHDELVEWYYDQQDEDEEDEDEDEVPGKPS